MSVTPIARLHVNGSPRNAIAQPIANIGAVEEIEFVMVGPTRSVAMKVSQVTTAGKTNPNGESDGRDQFEMFNVKKKWR
jgi:hypothetical protein